MDTYNAPSAYLVHHGVKGMKWGVRRYRNEDGTLTEAGKRRYKEDVAETRGKIQEARKRAMASESEKDFADVLYYERQLDDFKSRYKLEKQKTKSKRQLALEEKFQREDKLTKEEAELAAARKVKTERLIKAAAVVGVTAAVAYVAYRHRDAIADRVIKGSLQNLSVGDLDINRPFYASYKVMDNLRYKGAYGAELAKRGQVLQNVVGIKGGGLKLASRKTATSYMRNLVETDPAFRKSAKTVVSDFGRAFGAKPLTTKQIGKVVKEIDAGKLSSKSYDFLNRTFTQSIADRSSDARYVRDRLFDTLKKSGYGAIKDMNDARYSGYGSSDPLIVFAGYAKGALDKPVSKVLTSEAIAKSKAPALISMYGKQLAPGAAATVASYVAPEKLAKALTRKADTKYVREYRQEHPNSTLSANEILRIRDSK